MDELRALQAQFQTLQTQAAAQKLSDRVCVEILMKLLQRNMIQVYYTIDGKEYVTPTQLRREIEDELLAHGGRVRLTELQPMLNVDLTHIETHAHELCAADRSVQYIGGELVCDWYLDRLAEEVEESLQDAGHLHVSTLASRFGLSSEILTDVIERRIATPSEDREGEERKRRGRREIIHGRLEAPLLYTDAFVEQHTAVLRGLFSAVTVPTPIAALSKMFDFHHSLFFTILVELINSGRLAGSVHGRMDNAQFVPAVFTHQRTQYINRFFSQNGYIEYSVLQAFQIGDPAKYLKQHFSAGLALESCFVSATELLKLDACVAEAVQQGEWIDVSPIVPSPLSAKDVREMVQECACLKEAGGPSFVHLCDSYILSGTFLNTLLAKFRAHYDEWAASNTKKLLTSSSDQLRASAESLPDSSQEEDDDDDWSTGGKKGKGKKGKRRKGGKAAGGGKTKGKSKTKGNSASASTSGAADTETFDRENLQCLGQWHPELPEELTTALVEEMRSKLVALRDEASRVVFLGSDAKKRFAGTDWQEELHTLHWNISLFHRCATQHHDDSQFMEKHLLKSLCADAENLLLEANASHYFVQLDGPVLKAADRVRALKLLDGKPLHAPLLALHAASSTSVDEFLDALWDVADQMDIRLRKLDKRNQKELVEVHKKSLFQQLMEEHNPAHAYHLAVLVVYAKAHHMVLHVPGKLISSVLERVRGLVHSDVFERLHHFGGKSKALLTAKARKEPYDELLEELERSLPELKTAVAEEMERPAPEKQDKE